MLYTDVNGPITYSSRTVADAHIDDSDGYSSGYRVDEVKNRDKMFYMVFSYYQDYEGGGDELLYVTSEPIADVKILSKVYSKEEIEIVFLDETIAPVSIKFGGNIFIK